MVYLLIGVSLLIILAIGVAALFFAGKTHASASVEDLDREDD